jgi:nicotinamide mononucleotide transporter
VSIFESVSTIFGWVVFSFAMVIAFLSSLEGIAALISLIAIILVVRRSMWNYLFGIIGVLLYTQVFYSAKLYSDALLQIYFVILQLYGWWNWTRHRDSSGLAIVERLDARGQLQTALGVALITLALGFGMSRYTDAALPWWDAAIAGLSVVAQILQSLRKLENWLLWIATNIIAIGVYFTKALYPTTILYIILLGLAVVGLQTWRKQEI